jgi:hypothetical protein
MDFFVEDVGDITVNNGLVHIRCIGRKQSEDGATQEVEDKGSIVLPLAGFVRMEGTIRRAAEEMVRLGLLQRRESGVEASAEQPLEIDLEDLDAPAESKAESESESGEEAAQANKKPQQKRPSRRRRT